MSDRVLLVRPRWEWRCRGCNAVLGEASDFELVIGPAALTRTVTVRCVGCGTARTWYAMRWVANSQQATASGGRGTAEVWQ